MFIRTFVETRNWMSKKEPRKVSDLWKDMMNDLTSIQKTCEQLFPDDSKPKTGSGKWFYLPLQSPASSLFSQQNPAGLRGAAVRLDEATPRSMPLGTSL